jgi:hypothetical protein
LARLSALAADDCFGLTRIVNKTSRLAGRWMHVCSVDCPSVTLSTSCANGWESGRDGAEWDQS